MKTRQQEKQERALRSEERKLRAERAEHPIRLTPDAKLSKRDKHRLAEAFKKAKREGKIPQTAQQTIPYRQMYRDGVCMVTERYFTKQIEFFDITYQLAQNDDKNLIFENYCDFLNYFDSTIHVQFSFLEYRIDSDEIQRAFRFTPQLGDEFNGVRREYAEIIRSQQAKGNNGFVKVKYITFGIEADNLREAKLHLERIEADVLTNFKVLGVRARSMTGYERLSLLHRIFHPMGNQKFVFAWDAIWQTGLTTKDFIAPDSFTFSHNRHFQIGSTYGSVSYLQIMASELNDRMLAEILDLEPV